MKQGCIEIQEYQVSWQKYYKNEVQLLHEAFASHAITCHHIGSTSIPGMAAKPVIDIIVELPFIGFVDQYLMNLEDLGYINKGFCGIPRRRFFLRREDPEGRVDVHIHCLEKGSLHAQRQLRFRDYLIEHPEDAQRYIQLKLHLAELYPGDRLKYLQGKNALVQELDSLAAEWRPPGSLAPSCWKELKERKKKNLLDSFHHNFHMYSSYFSSLTKGLLMIPQKGDITLLRSEVNHPRYNRVLDAQFVDEEALESVKKVLEGFEENHHFSWWVRPQDSPKFLKGLLFKECLREGLKQQVMIREGGSYQLPRIDGMKLKRVSSAKDLKLFYRFLDQGGDLAQAYVKIYQKLPENAYIGDAAYRFFLIRFEGRDIGIVTLLFYAGVAGIYDLKCASEKTLQDCKPAVLQELLHLIQEENYPVTSTMVREEEQLLYQRLGFKNMGVYQEFLA